MSIYTCNECGESYCDDCGDCVEKEGACEICELFGSPSTKRKHRCKFAKEVRGIRLALLESDLDATKPLLMGIQAKLDVARRLEQAGWSVRASPWGIDCEAPEGTTFTVGKLVELGIPLELIQEGITSVRYFRTPAEIEEAAERLWDQHWYGRHQANLPFESDEQERHVTEKALKDLEDKYGRSELLVDGEYEVGKLRGKLSALIWLQGSEWDLRDCELDNNYYGV